MNEFAYTPVATKQIYNALTKCSESRVATRNALSNNCVDTGKTASPVDRSQFLIRSLNSFLFEKRRILKCTIKNQNVKSPS